MAFVSSSSRKILQSDTNPQFPSPAHYHLKQGSVKLERAPFRSTSVRKMEFIQHINQALPGPGHYEIRRQMIKPVISAYLNQGNVVVKINSTGSPEFKSQTVRFKDNKPSFQTSNLQQNQSIKQASNKQQSKKIAKIKFHKFPRITPIQLQSIPSKTRILDQDEQFDNQQYIDKNNESNPGPGFYQSMLAKHINSKGTVWAKDLTKRFHNFSTVQVGPGQYSIGNSIQPKGQKQNSANFKSGTIRSFFDSIMYHSSVEDIVIKRQKQNFKSPEPAPGQYYAQSFVDLNKNSSPFQFFGSSVDRFVDIQIKSQALNQFYNVGQYFGNNNSFNRAKCAFNSQTQRNSQFLDSSLNSQTPGPGKYEQLNRLTKRKKGKDIQMFGSGTERLKQLKKQIAQDLTKQSCQNTNNQASLIRSGFGQLQKQSCIFKSNTHRQCFGSLKNQTKIGEYDLSYNDVSKKLQRQRICIQNLKKIQVEKPPFESNQCRFAHYQSNKAINKDKSINNNDFPRKRKQDQQKNKKKSSLGGKIGKQQRFIKQQRKNGPGVGTYNYTINWSKPSFNSRFQQN